MSESRPTPSNGLVALYPGSFDPIHNGHIDIIRRAAELFGRVIVAVYDKPDKRLFLSTEERVELVRGAVAQWTNVESASYATLTVDYAAARVVRRTDDRHLRRSRFDRATQRLAIVNQF